MHCQRHPAEPHDRARSAEKQRCKSQRLLFFVRGLRPRGQARSLKKWHEHNAVRRDDHHAALLNRRGVRTTTPASRAPLPKGRSLGGAGREFEMAGAIAQQVSRIVVNFCRFAKKTYWTRVLFFSVFFFFAIWQIH